MVMIFVFPGSAARKVPDNDFVVGADPGNTNIITIGAPKRVEDGADGNLRQKAMRLLRLSRARYYRASAIMNARKKIETWNAGVKEHLAALSEVTSREADFEAFSEIHGSSHCALGCAVGGVYKAPVGSFAIEFVLWEAAGVREFLQSVERPIGG